MIERAVRKLDCSKTLLFAAAALLAVAAPLSAQDAPVQAPAGHASPPAQSSSDDWEKAAGGKQAFEVASVKQNISLGTSRSETPDINIPITPGNVYTPTGGLFSGTNVVLISYIYFAYKLTGNQIELLLAESPKWIVEDHFDIQARADGNPTKDQMRMMMQSLLADRFKLAIHYETRQLPVFAAVMSKPGKTGPQLQQHPADATCSTAAPPPSIPGSGPAPPSTVAGGFPTVCGGIVGMHASVPGRLRVGARNVPIGMLVATLAQMSSLDRPVLDQTGLSGTFDFTFEWTPQHNGAEANSATDDEGPTFQEALKQQLGLELKPQTGPVEVFVIDHVEMPSEN